MGAYLVDQDTSLLTIFDLAVTSRSVLAAYDFSKPLAVRFDDFIVKWKGVFLKELDLRSGTVSANALGFSVDGDLNDLSDEAARILLVITKNDRAAPQFVFYFGDVRPSDFKRPLFGTQLAQMKIWPETMKVSPVATLANLGGRIETKVAQADTVVATITTAEQQARAFRLTGERYQLINDFNALRKLVAGELGEMQQAHPELHIPADFVERVFPAERSAPKVLTAEQIKAKLDAAVDLVAKLQADYTKALEEEAVAAKAKQKAEAHVDQKRIGELEADIKRQQEELAALKAKKPPPDPGEGGTPGGGSPPGQ